MIGSTCYNIIIRVILFLAVAMLILLLIAICLFKDNDTVYLPTRHVINNIINVYPWHQCTCNRVFTNACTLDSIGYVFTLSIGPECMENQ